MTDTRVESSGGPTAIISACHTIYVCSTRSRPGTFIIHEQGSKRCKLRDLRETWHSVTLVVLPISTHSVDDLFLEMNFHELEKREIDFVCASSIIQGDKEIWISLRYIDDQIERKIERKRERECGRKLETRVDPLEVVLSRYTRAVYYRAKVIRWHRFTYEYVFVKSNLNLIPSKSLVISVLAKF